MNHALSARTKLLVSLFFAAPLAILGFQVAAWWGIAGGGLVGAMLASRVLMRGAAEAPPASPAMFVIAQSSDDTAEIDARRVARLKREFDRAVLEAADISTKRPVLH